MFRISDQKLIVSLRVRLLIFVGSTTNLRGRNEPASLCGPIGRKCFVVEPTRETPLVLMKTILNKAQTAHFWTRWVDKHQDARDSASNDLSPPTSDL